jgi:hypothetical protein
MMELLGRGAHASPSCGCSVVEYVSVLAGERWSSRPQSVHPAVAHVAGMVNDQMGDDRRRLLTPLAPWLLGGPRTVVMGRRPGRDGHVSSPYGCPLTWVI